MADTLLYPDTPLSLFILIVMLMLAIYVWQFKKTAGAKPHVYGLLCKAAWILCTVLVFYYQEASKKTFWAYMSCFFSIMIPYIWYIFILEISQQKESKAIGWGAAGITVFNLLAVISNPWHQLCWQEIFFIDGGMVIYGKLLMSLIRFNCCLLSALVLQLSVRWVLITAGVRRRQALWVTIANVSVIVGGILEILKTSAISPLRLSLLVSAVFISWAFFRWHVYDVLPFAQNAIVNNMREALLVIDEGGDIVKINATVGKMLSGLPCVVGTSFEKMTAMWPALQQLEKRLAQHTLEVTRESLGETRYFQLQKISLRKDEHDRGMAIFFKDITLQKQKQDEMLERQKAVVVLAERDRISRKVQDGQGKFLIYVKKQVQDIESMVRKGQLAEGYEQLKILSDMADTAFTDVREVIRSLKVSVESGDNIHR